MSASNACMLATFSMSVPEWRPTATPSLVPIQTISYLKISCFINESPLNNGDKSFPGCQANPWSSQSSLFYTLLPTLVNTCWARYCNMLSIVNIIINFHSIWTQHGLLAQSISTENMVESFMKSLNFFRIAQIISSEILLPKLDIMAIQIKLRLESALHCQLSTTSSLIYFFILLCSLLHGREFFRNFWNSWISF